MSGDQQIGQYLERACEAEAWAGATANETQKARWREIANGYRNLAQARLILSASEASPARRSPLPKPRSSRK